jgi:hypothetical protein
MVLLKAIETPRLVKEHIGIQHIVLSGTAGRSEPEVDELIGGEKVVDFLPGRSNDIEGCGGFGRSFGHIIGRER